MTSSHPYRIAVLSDLHAYSTWDKDPKPSSLCTQTSEDNPTTHPITGLKKLIDDESLRADLLICGGDLGHLAQPEGIRYAWGAVNEIGTMLEASHIVATVGNHDMDSRRQFNPYDPREVLQGLVPPFPLPDTASNDQYWSQHFAVLRNADVCIVLLDSAAYHESRDEIEHGRIADPTLERLREDLVAGGHRPLNVLVCHHHPQQHSELKLGEYDVMRNGQRLLDLLGSGIVGRWMVVHGHKHHPKISYAAGGSISPIVFSAGSLCSNLYPELATEVRNQFYSIDVPIDKTPELGLVGRFRSWEWAYQIGWRVARSDSTLPGRGSFGFRCDPELLAQAIARKIRHSSMKWNTVRRNFPGVEFLIPSDARLLESCLLKRNLLLRRDRRGDEISIEKTL